MSLLRTTAMLCVVIFAVGQRPAYAASPLTNLGPPTNNTPEYLPLGSFRHTGPLPKHNGKVSLVFIGTQVDDLSAAERWAIVKALGQFGKFTGVTKLLTHHCETVGTTAMASARIDCGNDVTRFGSTSTFDFRKAKYTSRFVEFLPFEMIDRNLNVRTTLPKTEMSLFDRYVEQPGYSSWHDAVWQTAINKSNYYRKSGLLFPLTDVGGYLETGANVVTGGDLVPNPAHQLNGLPYSTYPSFMDLQSALRTGKRRVTVPATFVSDTNAESNVITALICHADGGKPASVCGRSVIRGILKHVKG